MSTLVVLQSSKINPKLRVRTSLLIFLLFFRRIFNLRTTAITVDLIWEGGVGGGCDLHTFIFFFSLVFSLVTEIRIQCNSHVHAQRAWYLKSQLSELSKGSQRLQTFVIMFNNKRILEMKNNEYRKNYQKFKKY